MFSEYHEKYPSHGYRWLNAKIFFDTGIHMSDTHAHKCCKTLGIASKTRHHKFFKPRERSRIYPNLLMAGLNISGPLQYIVSDMTAFYFNKQYFELTLYMDIWNNEILAHSLSSKRGDRMTYFNGLKSILDLKANPISILFYIRTKVRFIRQRLIMTVYPIIILFVLCPEPAPPPTMPLLNRSTVGSKTSCSMTFI